MSQEARSALWFTLCNFIRRGTALITVPIFTRLLTETQYGICNVYFSWFDILVLFTSLNLPYEGLNNGLIRYDKDKDGYASAVAGLILSMTAIWVGGYILLVRKLSILAILMIIQLFTNPGLFLWTHRERFDFHYRWPVVITILSTVISVIVAVLVVINTEYKAEARILGIVAVQALFGIWAYAVLFIKGKHLYVKKYWSFALRFNLPLLFFYLAQIILNQSDRIMIDIYAGSDKAGIYSVAYTAASISMLLVTALNGSICPWIYRKLKEKEIGKIRQYAGSMILLVAGAVIGICVLAPDLVRILATERYAEAIYVIPPVAVSVFFVFIYMLYADVEMYYGKNRYIAVSSILAALLNVILNAVFIPQYGYIAAGWTTLFSYIFLAILHYLFLRKVCKEYAIQEPVFPHVYIWLLSMGMILIGFWMPTFYRMGYYRYLVLALVVILAGFVWRKRRE